MFGRRTVDGILGALTKTVKALDAHEAASLEQATYHSDQVQFHQGEAATAVDEANKAARVRDKLAALVA